VAEPRPGVHTVHALNLQQRHTPNPRNDASPRSIPSDTNALDTRTTRCARQSGQSVRVSTEPEVSQFAPGVERWQGVLGLTRDALRQELVSRQLQEHLPRSGTEPATTKEGAGGGDGDAARRSELARIRPLHFHRRGWWSTMSTRRLHESTGGTCCTHGLHLVTESSGGNSDCRRFGPTRAGDRPSLAGSSVEGRGT
jgi:hypothetical protein